MRQKQRNAARAQPRHARIERVEPVEVNSEESHLWAVSYSDLLMVLMSFFIIFFSIEEDSRDDLLKEIAVTIAPNTNTLAAANSPASQTKILNLEAIATVLNTNLADENTMTLTEVKKGTVHVQFPENAFAIRQYKLSKELKGNLKNLVDATKPFADRIKLTFIGHSDSRQLIIRDDDGIIKDNYVLSALRANEAMQYAATLGIPAETLYLQGSASNALNSRTISVRIERR